MYLNGGKNIFEILSYLNMKSFFILSDHWKKIIRRMFPEIRDNDEIRAYLYKDALSKIDMVILAGRRRVNLSVKYDKDSVFHRELFHSFTRFLSLNGISSRALKTISFYHFGRSEKLDNKGKPFSRKTIISRFKTYIDDANAELNSSELIKKIANRAFMEGSNPSRGRIDWFYFGNKEDGFLLDYDEICMNINRGDCLCKEGICIGTLPYSSYNQDFGKKEKSYVVIKWPLLADALNKKTSIKKKEAISLTKK